MGTRQSPVKQAPGPASSTPSLGRETLIDPKLVDEFAPLLQRKRALDAEIRVLTAEGSRFYDLEKLIREAADKRPAEQRLMLHGLKFDIEATPRENEASPDWKKLVRAFSLKTLLPFVQITQKAVKALLVTKALPEADYEGFFTKARTGSRKLTVVTKSLPAQEAA